MSQSSALTVLATPAVDDPDTQTGALISNCEDRVVQNGPGMHLNLAFSAGGVYVEAGLRGVAKLLELGPVPVVQAVETIFADAAQRIAILDELFLLRPRPADENSGAQPQTAPKASKTTVKLKKLCRKLLKFTSSNELPDTQILAYKGIVMLTTRYIGLRLLFVEQLPFKHSARQPSNGDIVRAWRHGSSGDPEWEFWIEFAVYCVASPDEITVIVETLKPSNFGCFEEAQCVSERLAHWISSTLTANDESRRLAVRYLAGILELPSFWDFRIKNDLHSASDGVCLISIRLLEDLAVECEERHFTLIDDLVTLDPEGINMLMFATLNRLPLKLLPDDDMRSTNSLEIAERLIQRLQTERSKALFPEASKRAERFLPKPKTAPAETTPAETTPAKKSKGARYVIVMGPTAVGKSSFIWAASGEGQDRIQHGLAPVPVDITAIECQHPSQADGRPVIFVDTPGFEDLPHFEHHGLQNIANWINKNIKKNNDVELAGIIFLHRISDNRMSGSLIRQLQILRDLCGMDVMKNVVVTTTMWEAGVSEDVARQRHKELRTTWLEEMIKKGCKLEEFRGTKDSAWKSIDYLLDQEPCPPLLVQKEMAKRGFWSRLFADSLSSST